jgi:hypothetical protein
LCHEVLLKMMKSWLIDNVVQDGVVKPPCAAGTVRFWW